MQRVNANYNTGNSPSAHEVRRLEHWLVCAHNTAELHDRHVVTQKPGGKYHDCSDIPQAESATKGSANK